MNYRKVDFSVNDEGVENRAVAWLLPDPGQNVFV